MLRFPFAPSALALLLLTGVAFGQNTHTAKPKAKPASHTTKAKVTTPPVAVSKGPQFTYTRVNVDAPYIAITFDDGPHKTFTPRLLDILAKRGIKATFFVLGQRVEAEPQVARQIVAQGHEIAEHSWSHPNLGKMSDANVRGQLQRSRAAILKATGVAPKVFRPPYGSFSERQRRWAYQEFGYPTILWDVDPLDWKRPGASVVADRILSRTQPGSIILVHDIHSQSVDAIPQVLDTLLSRGYRFVTVSELLKLDRPLAPKATPTTTAATAATPANPVGGAPTPDVTVLPAEPVTPPTPATLSPAEAPPTVLPATPVAPPNR